MTKQKTKTEDPVDETPSADPMAAVAEEFVKLADGLPPEQRAKLAQLGYVIPSGTVRAALEGKYELGYRCKECNEIAIYFVGTSWPEGQVLALKDGSERECPPLHVPIERIAWTQDLPAHEIDRHSPKCQGRGGNCRTPLHLTAHRCLMARLITPIAWFETARDKAFDRLNVQRTLAERQKFGGDAGPSNYDDKRDVPSQFLSEQQKAEITYIADKYDPLAVTRKDN